MQPFRLTGVPGWASDTRFDIAVTLDQLANGMLSLMLDGVVRTETKTEGAFDVELSWRPDVAGAASDPNDARPGFFAAV